ncbi:peroxiredoxin [Halobiforma lacisalsi AJ5]|uniref:Alkyl hydroperoxide reductase/ thiol specific antioxidant/ Mal allergen n=1 Tax=Natronobacterium lacisalsi AJ5 TaxID=358396 RepID=M0LVL1_NATLA|nr:redoxin domain-containing protein [Halobiforma lacisalsi]APW99699.1 peroxiredoxin [Halobiforma lacisalsi AJ5]EMA36130.1 alkyl hydroperoxide reductase/ thiol specific antioxidant/ Mal allergen [Halobiforma lacisalsi AJ5]
MVETGDAAPDFTAPLANGDVESFTLSERLEDEAPIVLAFFPGAFTSVCTAEMCTFQDRLSAFDDVDAEVYGVSRDSPFTLNEFRAQNDLEFGLISDLNREVVDQFGVEMDFTDLGVHGVAKRSVFVIDSDGEITYSWVSDDPGVEPEYVEVEAAAEDAA